VWIFELHHLAVDIILCQFLPGVLCALEYILKEFHAHVNAVQVIGQLDTIVVPQIYHLLAVKIVGVIRLAL
jgi:hypothetical protein